MNRVSAVGVALVAVGFLVGCGGGGPAMNYVEGTVTLDGEPVSGAIVTFSPATGSTGKPAVGTSNESGVFKLTDMSGGATDAGAAAGDYEIGVVKNAGPTANPDPDAWKTDPNYGKPSADVHTQATPLTFEVPKRYNDPKTSGLKMTVQSGENKGIKLELKKS